MTSNDSQENERTAAREVYARLAAATPAERTEIVLELMRGHPQGRLELPGMDGIQAMLDEIDLTRLTPGEGTVPGGQASLRDADLRGASLRKANLVGTDISHANLQGTLLGGANLRRACLEGANLQQADMADVDLEGANLGEVNFQGAMLEEANLRDATLRFANLSAAVLENADLRGADLRGANLQDAVVSNADLQGAGLEEANLRHADLSGANLQGVLLRRANLEGAVLKNARLQGVDLSSCTITHIHLSGARLDETRIQLEQLGGAIGEELAGDFGEARKGYLALERAFEELGDPDASSWAYRRRRRMQKREVLGRARSARAEGRWRSSVRSYAQYASDQFVEWLCDYGESIPRVLGALLALYLLFIVIYGLTGSVVREEESASGVVRVLTRKPADLAIFSLLAMTTGSIGIRFLPRNDLALTLVGIQVFAGVALIGLLGFVLGNRIRR